MGRGWYRRAACQAERLPEQRWRGWKDELWVIGTGGEDVGMKLS